MLVSHSDPATQWSFQYAAAAGGAAEPGGLVLKDVRHDGHNFARDARLVGMWLEVETVAPSGAVTGTDWEFLALGPPHFGLGTIDVVAPTPVATSGVTVQELAPAVDARQFAAYFNGASPSGLALRVLYPGNAPALAARFANCETLRLDLAQIWLFSSYSNAVAHEPSGALSAARFHPMTRFELVPNPAVDRSVPRTRIASLRFDYRLHLFLDRHHTSPSASPQIGNQAGLFSDRDSLAAAAAAGGADALGRWLRGGGGLGGIPGAIGGHAESFSAAAFRAVEKPLVLEVVAPGLERGLLSGSAPNPFQCWDNVHWWSARGPGAPIISTPGGFHAAHLHWRWGAASPSSAPQFGGTGVPAPVTASQYGGRWGPLVHPDCWIQTIRAAIVRNEPSLDPDTHRPADLSRRTWQDLFTGLPRPPQDIEVGGDLVLWFSIQCHSELVAAGASAATYRWAGRGVVFMHGIFFAHEADRTGATVGTTGPLHWPRTPASIRASPAWFRDAS